MKTPRGAKKSAGKGASPYGYPWADWLAREDPPYAAARGPVSALSVGGPTLSAGVKGLMQLEAEGAFRGR